MPYTLRRTRHIKNKTVKRTKISPGAKKLVDQYRQKYTISKILYGKKAFDAAAQILFPNSPQEAEKWGSQFSSSKKSSSVFFIAKKKRGSGTVMKLIMGRGNDLSIIGEKIHT
jgi:hypothetical protein